MKILFLILLFGACFAQNNVDPISFQFDKMIRFLLTLPESVTNKKQMPAEGNVQFLCTNP